MTDRVTGWRSTTGAFINHDPTDRSSTPSETVRAAYAHISRVKRFRVQVLPRHRTPLLLHFARDRVLKPPTDPGRVDVLGATSSDANGPRQLRWDVKLFRTACSALTRAAADQITGSPPTAFLGSHVRVGLRTIQPDRRGARRGTAPAGQGRSFRSSGLPRPTGRHTDGAGDRAAASTDIDGRSHEHFRHSPAKSSSSSGRARESDRAHPSRGGAALAPSHAPEPARCTENRLPPDDNGFTSGPSGDWRA